MCLRMCSRWEVHYSSTTVREGLCVCQAVWNTGMNKTVDFCLQALAELWRWKVGGRSGRMKSEVSAEAPGHKGRCIPVEGPESL